MKLLSIKLLTAFLYKCWKQRACKYLQIRANPHASYAKKKLNKFLSIFWVKWVCHKLYIFQLLIFYTNWPSLLYRVQYTVEAVDLYQTWQIKNSYIWAVSFWNSETTFIKCFFIFQTICPEFKFLKSTKTHHKTNYNVSNNVFLEIR